MYCRLISGAIHGVSCKLTGVEVDIAHGMPYFDLIGYAGSEVKEARERVRVALKNNHYDLPPMRITVNLSPADMRKEGSGYDLPIAIGILCSMNYLSKESFTDIQKEKILMLGELGLNGEVKPVKGVLPLVKKAKEEGLTHCMVPWGNQREASIIRGINIVGVKNLTEAVAFLEATEITKESMLVQGEDPISDSCKEEDFPDFQDVNGQAGVKRVCEISASGFHHFLMIGPPGSGKTMIAKRIPGILPPLTYEESLEISSIFSIAGLLNENQYFITKRQFLNPHHTSTPYSLIGGGRNPKPGLISQAHHSVLFLDELTEFKRETLDLLRQPLEERKIRIARMGGTYTFPANFLFVGALNPCPCGYYPDLNRCRCTPFQVEQYLSRISGPILDRIDLLIEVEKLEISDLIETRKNESSKTIRQRVMEARKRQEKRFMGSPYQYNSQIPANQMRKYCPLGLKEERWMEQIFKKMNFSARGYYKTIKIARTIADLEGEEKILCHHLSEAVCYRTANQKYWKG